MSTCVCLCVCGGVFTPNGVLIDFTDVSFFVQLGCALSFHAVCSVIPRVCACVCVFVNTHVRVPQVEDEISTKRTLRR